MDVNALIGQAQSAYSAGAQMRATSAVNSAAENQKKAKETAENFEAMFVGQMLKHMWEGVGNDPVFGGGHAEEMWQSMLTDEYGKNVVKNGGLGISKSVMASMLRAQEEKTVADQKLAAMTTTNDAESEASDTGTAGAAVTASVVRR
jgi:Rod binding domain-containing protein